MQTSYSLSNLLRYLLLQHKPVESWPHELDVVKFLSSFSKTSPLTQLY